MSNLLVRPATQDDAATIQGVEDLAFDESYRLFPGILNDRKGYIAHATETYRKIIADKDGDQTWMVAEDTATGTIAGVLRFRKVDDACAQPHAYISEIPFGGEETVRFVNASILMRREVMKNRPHYHLQTLATCPAFQRRGVGSQLLAHLTNISNTSKIPIYLQGSPTGLHIYRKHGFVEQGPTVLFPVAPGQEPDGEVVTVMVREPQHMNGAA
ncbi:acyl-CoA N-acyltransferase [Auriculariales sp. MPI-PUGE-AT-0066]|nr:acyl-CoA N-acyltransferase [Auriculariales sp. MPI-PUGE-AT-0066]